MGDGRSRHPLFFAFSFVKAFHRAGRTSAAFQRMITESRFLFLLWWRFTPVHDTRTTFLGFDILGRM